ncbi:hypothetical protein HanPI659440_Chr04g0145811 [Helianthus annuus]|nr:hypothetical protein HanPI659440_Chr04g0145811 [Helianthus annuus]
MFGDVSGDSGTPRDRSGSKKKIPGNEIFKLFSVCETERPSATHICAVGDGTLSPDALSSCLRTILATQHFRSRRRRHFLIHSFQNCLFVMRSF